MPAHKKKHSTHPPTLPPSTEENVSLLNPQEFYAHLRTLVRGATRVVIEEIMEEELTAFLQAE